MSKKSQIAVRNLKRVQKYLQDQYIIEEIEEVIGEGSYNFLKNLCNKPTVTKNQETRKEDEAPQDMDKEDDEGTHEMDELPSQNVKCLMNVSKLAGAKSIFTPGRPEQVTAKQVALARDTSQSERRNLNTQVNVQHSQPLLPEGGNNTMNNILQSELRPTPRNPYIPSSTRQIPNQEAGTLHANRNKVDKQVILKKGMVMMHIHRYTLRFKTRKTKEEEEEGYQIIQDTLQKFLGVVLQADPKTIIPRYLQLDRADNSVPNLSNLFTASAIDLYYALKKYFFRLSPRDEAGIS
jgi:hypothetical protein